MQRATPERSTQRRLPKCSGEPAEEMPVMLADRRLGPRVHFIVKSVEEGVVVVGEVRKGRQSRWREHLSAMRNGRPEHRMDIATRDAAMRCRKAKLMHGVMAATIAQNRRPSIGSGRRLRICERRQ